MMRRTAGLLALAMLLPGPVAAHDETPSYVYAEGLVPILETGSTWGDIGADVDAIRASATAMAADLRTLLLATVPETCYRDSWVAAWVWYAGLIHIAEAPDLETLLAHLTTLTAEGSDVTTLLIDGCPVS